MTEEKKIATGYIGNALRSVADNHTTTFADEIFDTERQKYQNEVNTDLETTDNEIKAGLEAETARATAAEENLIGKITEVSSEVSGTIHFNTTPSRGVNTIAENIAIKANIKYVFSVKSAGALTADFLGFYVVKPDNTNLKSLIVMNSSDTWDGSERSVSFTATEDIVVKITSYADTLTETNDCVVTLLSTDNITTRLNRLEEQVEQVESMGTTAFLSKECIDVKIISKVTFTKSKIPLIKGHKYKFAISLESSVSDISSWGIEDGVSFGLPVGSTGRDVEYTYNGEYAEKRLFVFFPGYTGKCYVSVIDITVDDVRNSLSTALFTEIEGANINASSGTYEKSKISTSGSSLTIVISRTVFANRIVRLYCDNLEGIKALYGITYNDNTTKQRFANGGYAEFVSDKDVKEVFVYVQPEENTFDGQCTLVCKINSADSGCDGLVFKKTVTSVLDRVVEIKEVSLVSGHTYVITVKASADYPKTGFFIENNGTNLASKYTSINNTEKNVIEYTADGNYNPRITTYRNSASDVFDMEIKMYDKTIIGKNLLERLVDIENTASRNEKSFASTIYVAASNSSAVDKTGADFVCDGTNDEVEINNALVSVGNCGTVVLLKGDYYIDKFNSYEGYPKTAIAVKPNGFVGITLKGITHYHGGTTLHVTETAFSDIAEDEQPNVICFHGPKENSTSSRFNLQDMAIILPNWRRKAIAVNLQWCGCGEEKNLKLMAFGDSRINIDSKPNDFVYTDVAEDLVGIRSFCGWTYGDTTRFDNISVYGFHRAFQLGAEHLVVTCCRARINYCGYTFGEYHTEITSGAFDHPTTLINCCDEQSYRGVLFDYCGLNTPNYDITHDRKLQSVTMIDFNTEEPVGTPKATESIPGMFCGVIDYHPSDGTFGAFVNKSFWENDGSGHNFKTRNTTHALGGTTALRNTYLPNYMQQYFDTDLNKLLVWNGNSWVEV